MVVLALAASYAALLPDGSSEGNNIIASKVGNMSSTATRTKDAAAGGSTSKSKSGGSSSSNPKKNSKSKKKQQQSAAAAKQQPKQPPPPPPPKICAIDPPLECSQSDFEALLGDAAGLASHEEASAELLDCARYGEVDACRAILDVWSSHNKEEQTSGEDDNTKSSIAANDEKEGASEKIPSVIVDAQDASKSTSLHRACANGHKSTVQLLLSRGAEHLQNDSGNTPLHWAAGAGHGDCVKLLLDHYDALCSRKKRECSNADEDVKNGQNGGKNSSNNEEPLDVLLKNDFGRSAMTEGFASGDTKTVEHLLNHDSAEEEKLIGGLNKEETEVEEEDVVGGDRQKKGGGKKKSIVHEFDFLRESVEEGEEVGSGNAEGGRRPAVFIRELVSINIMICIKMPIEF